MGMAGGGLDHPRRHQQTVRHDPGQPGGHRGGVVPVDGVPVPGGGRIAEQITTAGRLGQRWKLGSRRRAAAARWDRSLMARSSGPGSLPVSSDSAGTASTTTKLDAEVCTRPGAVAGGDIEPDERGRTPRTDPPDDTLHLDLAPDAEGAVPLECLLGVDHPATGKLRCGQQVLGHCEQRHRGEGRWGRRRPSLGVVPCGRHQIRHPVGGDGERDRSDPPTFEAVRMADRRQRPRRPDAIGTGSRRLLAYPRPDADLLTPPAGSARQATTGRPPRPWDQRVSRCSVWVAAPAAVLLQSEPVPGVGLVLGGDVVATLAHVTSQRQRRSLVRRHARSLASLVRSTWYSVLSTQTPVVPYSFVLFFLSTKY